MALAEQLALLRAQVAAYRTRAREVEAKLRAFAPRNDVRDLRTRLHETTASFDRYAATLRRRVRARGTGT
ncbi:MAG TPA: hypothetical protein VGF94_00530 [Kofleriaceae bacterium]|jgi:predicted secreted Zn-dependent protease